MKTLIATVALIASTGAVLADTYVNGYTRRDGTYVAPHYRTAPDSNRYNNYSSQGMVNPYTGRNGTASPYGTYSNPYGSTQRRNTYGIYGR
jgi:hypothetical protein